MDGSSSDLEITCAITSFITCGAKLLNADWLRQRAFFLNHEGTFGNQEGMIIITGVTAGNGRDTVYSIFK